MKRYNHLYENICKIENIENAFNEVKKNTRNKRRVFNMKQYKSYYISSVYNILNTNSYVVGKYNKFVIKEPKERVIVSQQVIDKIINHLVARYILYPSLFPCLLDVNVASRKNLGTSAGIKYVKEFNRKCKVKYKDYYILKCDISKFFNSIDHDILKIKLRTRIKDKKALEIVDKIIDSNEKGLYIGCMTNQALAIFFLHKMDCFVKEKLKIKYYVRYQDDFLLFHESKDYLRFCYFELEKFLNEEGLLFNKKSRIFKNNNHFCFLGRDLNGKYIRYRNIKRNIKKKKENYFNNKISLNSFISTISSYSGLLDYNIKIG